MMSLLIRVKEELNSQRPYSIVSFSLVFHGIPGNYDTYRGSLLTKKLMVSAATFVRRTLAFDFSAMSNKLIPTTTIAIPTNACQHRRHGAKARLFESDSTLPALATGRARPRRTPMWVLCVHQPVDIWAKQDQAARKPPVLCYNGQ